MFGILGVILGPLIVSFYRGVWCPYCNMDLQALETAKPEFEKFGASLVARARGEEPPEGGYLGNYVIEMAERMKQAR